MDEFSSWIRQARPYVLPVGNYFFTPILIGLNLLMFGLMTATSTVWWQTIVLADLSSLERWGGNARYLTLGHQEWWRLLSCAFQHLNMYHLLMNMLTLYFVGSILEKVLGRWLFLSAYLFCAICSGAASLIWHDTNLSVGASGAIFGLCGIFLTMITFSIEGLPRKKGLWIFILIFLIYNLLNGIFDKTLPIDNAGHIGGIVSGGAIGTLLCISLRQEKEILKKYVIPAGGSLILLILFFLPLPFLKLYQISDFRALLNTYSYHESQALSAFPTDSMLRLSPKPRLVKQAEESLEQWNKCLLNAHKMEELQLPKQFQQFNTQLLLYTQLQVRKNRWCLNQLKTGTLVSPIMINSINARIDSIGFIVAQEITELY